MPVLTFKGKTAIETYHHTVPHHVLEVDRKLSELPKGEAPSLNGNLPDGKPLQRSLFDIVPADLNEYEKADALVLDRHPQVLWWYRNLVGERHFSIQGFRKSPVYPDFVVQTSANGGKPSAKVLVIESKGAQLKGSEDTTYKRDLARLFEECGKEVTWQEISSGFAERRFRFQILDQGDYTGEEWKDAIDGLIREP